MVVLQNNIVQGLLMLVTLVALFGDDFRLLTLPPSLDATCSTLTFVILCVILYDTSIVYWQKLRRGVILPEPHRASPCLLASQFLTSEFGLGEQLSLRRRVAGQHSLQSAVYLQTLLLARPPGHAILDTRRFLHQRAHICGCLRKTALAFSCHSSCSQCHAHGVRGCSLKANRSIVTTGNPAEYRDYTYALHDRDR
eukprot:SAG11_NODE_4088_length_2071_cov_1.191176_2_plen_196_part_00